MNARTSFRTRAIALTVGVVASTAIGISTAPAASAAVWGCSTGYSTVGAWGRCSYGDVAYFKVNVLCQNRFTFASRTVSGQPERVGGQYASIVPGCAWYEHFYGNPWANSA